MVGEVYSLAERFEKQLGLLLQYELSHDEDPIERPNHLCCQILEFVEVMVANLDQVQ